jgi:decaprenyl-phosphate phosphoribosyltransferase
VLELYTPRALRIILIASAAAAIGAYCVWAFKLAAPHGVPWRPLTIAPFVLCLARYGALIRAGRGEAPEELILSDRRLALSAAAWLLLFSLGLAVS